MLMDIMVALFIAAALLMSLAAAVGKLHRSQRQMADSRAATRRLEQALIALQAGAAPDPQLQIERLPDNLPGRVWVRLSLPALPGIDQPRPSLVGLVPAANIPGGAP